MFAYCDSGKLLSVDFEDLFLKLIFVFACFAFPQIYWLLYPPSDFTHWIRVKHENKVEIGLFLMKGK